MFRRISQAISQRLYSRKADRNIYDAGTLTGRKYPLRLGTIPWSLYVMLKADGYLSEKIWKKFYKLDCLIGIKWEQIPDQYPDYALHPWYRNQIVTTDEAERLKLGVAVSGGG